MSEPTSGACVGTTESPIGSRVRLARIQSTPLDPVEVLAAVAHPNAGGVDLFVGAVRDHDSERGVLALDYSAHPSAEERLRRVCLEVAERHEVVALAAVHRVGPLKVGDLAVLVATSAPHRGACFAATRDLIDTLKAEVPIWKHQHFADGDQEWVGTP